MILILRFSYCFFVISFCFRSLFCLVFRFALIGSRDLYGVSTTFDIGFSMSASADLEIGSREKSLDPNQADLDADLQKPDNVPQYKQDAFGDEEFAEVKYKVLKWWYVCIASIL